MDLDKLKIEVLQEVEAIHGNPAETLGNVRKMLETLYKVSDDKNKAVIASAWDQIETFNAQFGGAVDVAAGSRAAAQEFAEKLRLTLSQMDGIKRDIDELTFAIERRDMLNPKVGDLITDIRDEVEEEILHSGGYVTYCAGCDIIQNTTADVVHDVALLFHEYLVGVVTIPTGELQARLEEFMIGFVMDCQTAKREAVRRDND